MDENEITAERTQEEARVWLMLLYSEEASHADRSAFEHWLKQSELNASVYQKLEQAWRDLALVEGEHPSLTSANSGTSIDQDLPGKLSRRALLGGGAAAGFALAAAVFSWHALHLPKETVLNFTTAVGRVEQFGLPDGSVVVLDTNSAIRMVFDNSERRVSLLRGRVNFDIENDPSRPFTVDAGFGQVVVTGTNFDVWRTASEMRVGVTEGTVDVLTRTQEADSGAERSITLSKGDASTLTPSTEIPEVTKFDEEKSRDWRIGRLSYVNDPLGAVVNDVNRYRIDPILIEDERLAGLRVTMSFRFDQTEQFLQGLEATQPIAVARSPDIIRLYAKN